MLLDVGCTLAYEITAPTPVILMLRPRSGPAQWVRQEIYAFTPELFATEYTDGYGNLCQRLVLPAGEVSITTRATVNTGDTIDTAPGTPLTLVQDLPDNVLPFLLPSRYCPADLPQILEQAKDVVGDAAPGYDQAEAIRAWIQEHCEYRYGSSNVNSWALDTLEQRAGVCRDFAHLGMALCRSLSIPARMVVGYLYQLDPMDQHAWFEAYIGGRWYVFDATQKHPSGGRVSLAYGRDAADVAFATLFGPATLQEMHVWVERTD